MKGSRAFLYKQGIKYTDENKISVEVLVTIPEASIPRGGMYLTPTITFLLIRLRRGSLLS